MLECFYHYFPPGTLTLILAVVAAVSALPKIAEWIKNSWLAHAVVVCVFFLIAAAEGLVIRHADEVSNQHYLALSGQAQKAIELGQTTQQIMLTVQQAITDLPKVTAQLNQARAASKGQESLKTQALALSKDILSFLSAQEGTMPQMRWPPTAESQSEDSKTINQYMQTNLAMFDHDFGSRIAQILGKAKSEHADYTTAQNACSTVNNFFAMRSCALALSGVSAKDLPGRTVMQRLQPSQ